MKLINKNDMFLLEQLVKRNFSSKYKDSVLGIIWSVLRPLLIMFLLTIIFSTFFGQRIENYPVYFLCGRCLYDFFNGAVYVSMNSIRGNKNILNRSAAPKHIFILSSVISEFLNLIISLFILMVVMLVTSTPFYLNIMPLAVIPIISLLIMVTGLGLMLSIVCVYYSDIQHLWGVIALALMYGSAIFYPMDIIPEPYYQFMILNPVYWVIDQFRCLMYQGIIPQTHDIINSLLLSLIIFVFGLIVFKKYEKIITMKF